MQHVFMLAKHGPRVMFDEWIQHDSILSTIFDFIMNTKSVID